MDGVGIGVRMADEKREGLALGVERGTGVLSSIKGIGVTEGIGVGLDRARKALLDLGRRNRLIHLRERTRTALWIVDEKPIEVMRKLTDEAERMEFLSVECREVSGLSEAKGVEGGEEQSVAEKTGEEGEVNDRHRDRFLETALSKKALEEKLLLLSRETQTAIEEQGTHLLFLSLGFLEWSDGSQPENMMVSPLVLLPVELSRKNILTPFKLEYNGEDIQTNLCLEKKLHDEYGIEFLSDQKIESAEDYGVYVSGLAKQIENRERWRISDRIALGLFTFTKFLMYRDLDPVAWKPVSRLLDQPLLQSLLTGKPWNPPGEGVRSGKDVNQSKDAGEVLIEREIGADFLVLDADESQREAVKAVRDGKNLIIQGPPGTGKSQTIANLISESLGNGRRVLFVSEKRAALEVVKNRLDKVGLGDFCLELHSRDSSKRGFLDSMERTLTGPRPLMPKDERDRHEYAETLQWLRSVGDELLMPVGNTGFSPYYLMGKCLSYRKKQLPEVSLGAEIFSEPQVLEECTRLTEEYANSLRKIGNPGEHIYWDVEAIDILPNEVEQSRFLFGELNQYLEGLVRTANEVSHRIGVQQARTFGEAGLLIDLWDRLNDNPYTLRKDLELIDWSLAPEVVETFSVSWKAYGVKHKKLAEFYDLACIPWNDLDRHRSIIEKSAGSMLRFMNSEYKESCKAIRACLKSRQSMGGEDLLKAIEFLKDSQGEKRAFEAVESIGPYLIGTVWKGIETPEAMVMERLEWLKRCRPVVDAGMIEPLRLAELASGSSWKGAAPYLEDLEKSLHHTESTIASVDALLSTPRMRWNRIQEKLIDGYAERIKRMGAEVDALWDWVEFRRSQHLLIESAARGLDELAISGDVDETNAVETLHNQYFCRLVEEAFKDRPQLSSFRRDKLEAMIGRFQVLDQKMIYHARQRLAYELGHRTPKVIEGLAGASSELGVLQREIHKKRRIKPIRKILEEAASLIQKIKPCFMMSPLSVAQFLPPGDVEFDIVIFDEASQMKPEDALGAIARGRQLVVVGDSRQLPPTRFFSRLESDDVDWEEGEESLSDLESILDACGATGMPSRTLSWHYRSQHDSLIATSNREFYENRLVIFPSPFERNEKLGLEFIKVENGLFQRGKSGSNPEEAKVVARAVMEHARTRPGDSLGVGTFSIRQQAEVLDEIEKLRREAADPGLEKFFQLDVDEPFFVKNLENIQGDERDVIFLSVCYARHEPDKPMMMNFGPLNQEGGERRLNVLITRAKKKCVVFSSISSDDIDLEKTDARGVKALKSFLQFAEYGSRDFLEDTINDEASPLEARVHESLHNLGYQVVRQVGTGIFRLNFGIRHPDKTDRFILGLECDGSAYMTAPGSRERERTRPTVLSRMGWKIHRIWSTEFYRYPERTIDDILRVLKASAEVNVSSGIAEVRAPEFDGIQVESSNGAISLSGLAVPYMVFEGPVPKTGRTLAKEVVSAEGPIHWEHLIERLKELLEVPRLSAKVKSELENHILTALRDQVILRLDGENDFFIPKNFILKEFSPRKRDKAPTEPGWIPDLEILAAADRIVRLTGEIPLDELMKNISVVLGYRALNARLQSRLEDALSRNKLRRIALKMDHRKRILPASEFPSIFGIPT